MSELERALRILVIDDSPEDREIYGRFLHRDPEHAYEVFLAESGEQGLELLREQEVDCVLLDYSLPDGDGLEILSLLTQPESENERAVVMVTGHGNEAVAVEAMKRGVQDYVVKSGLSAQALGRAVGNAVEKVKLRRELRRGQRELEETRCEQLRLKDEFLSKVSHELRTPLTAIHEFVSLVLDGAAGETNPEQRDYLEVAFRNAKQLRKMIDDLMEATRVQAGKLRVDARPVDLGLLTAETVRVLQSTAAAKELSLQAQVDPALSSVVGDEARVRQVLNNLVENAIKFTPETGSILVHARPDPEHAQFARVSITDTGCGIGDEGTQRIFERLHQEDSGLWASRKGLGYGLHICQELILRQGGRIWVESKLGEGSTFHFTLPVLSLARLVAPAVSDGEHLRSVFSMVRVRLTLAESDSGTGVPESLADQLYGLVEAGIRGRSDILLPHPAVVCPGEAFVVTSAHGEGLEALVKRLRDRVAENEAVRAARLTVSVESVVEETSSADRVAGLEEGIQRAAARVGQWIQDSRNGEV